MIYNIADLRWTSAREYRQMPTGRFTTNRNGRRVEITEGAEFVKTNVGTFELSKWYLLMEEAVRLEKKENLLKKIIKNCRNNAWLKTDQAVREYALECLSSEAYLHWPEWKGELNG